MLLSLHLFFRKSLSVNRNSWDFWISMKKERYGVLGNEFDKNWIEDIYSVVYTAIFKTSGIYSGSFVAYSKPQTTIERWEQSLITESYSNSRQWYRWLSVGFVGGFSSISFGYLCISFVGLTTNKKMMMMMILPITSIARMNHRYHPLLSQKHGFHVGIRMIPSTWSVNSSLFLFVFCCCYCYFC